MTKLYFHNAATAVSGTLPTAEQNTAISSIDAESLSQSTNKTMNTTIGTSVATLTVNKTVAGSGVRNYYFTRFISAPIAAQTISANTWNISFAVTETSTNGNFPVTSTNQTIPITCYIWRPSTGAKVGDICNGTSGATFSEPTTANSRQSNSGTFTGSSVACLSGDVICIEFIFSPDLQAGTFDLSIHYDGTTESFTTRSVVSSHAGYLETPQTLTFAGSAITTTVTGKAVKTKQIVQV